MTLGVNTPIGELTPVLNSSGEKIALCDSRAFSSRGPEGFSDKQYLDVSAAKMQVALDFSHSYGGNLMGGVLINRSLNEFNVNAAMRESIFKNIGWM